MNGYQLLNIFKSKPFAVLSTTEIVKELEPEEFQKIQVLLNDPFDRDKIKQGKRKKAQLHRKILYYLSKLTAEGILKVEREGKKGEKFFSLNIQEGEEISISPYKKRKIIISKPRTPSIPIEGYEHQKIIHKFEPETWLERLNSIIIELLSFSSMEELNEVIDTCFANLNDTLALYHFVEWAEQNQSIAQDFLRNLENKCQDYNKKVSLIVNTEKINNQPFFLELIKHLWKHLHFIFEVNPRDLRDKVSFFQEIIKYYSLHDLRLYLKNHNIHQAPYFIGKVGPYSFTDQEWRKCQELLKTGIAGLVCGQTSVIVDNSAFYKNYTFQKAPFQEFISKLAHSILVFNSIQRRKADQFFKSLLLMQKERIKDFFMFSKNYIRFWNYGWKDSNFDQEYLVDMFSEVKNEIEKFCIHEETIFKSCGMPTRFQIVFACALDFGDILSEPSYQKFFIKTFQELTSPENQHILETKEKLFNFFTGGDIVTFHHLTTTHPKEVIQEISVILNSYKIPFFRYRFEKSQQESTLLNYLK